MKSTLYLKKYLWLYLIAALLPAACLQAQICQDPADTIYGLSTTGVIYPINVSVSPLTIGAPLDSATDGNAPSNSNGIGFSVLNHRFYYFERSAAGGVNPQRFVYYDPTVSPAVVLGRAAPPFSITNKCRSGCVNTAGNGYYTIDPAAAGGPSLYYFNILTNAWTTITTVFKDPSSVNISGTFSSLNSGDMAFDGSGNLWILCSSTTKYGLFKISAPVPTTAQAFVTATQIIAPTTSTPVSGFSITGLAFSSTGAVYLSTGSGDNKLYKMTSTLTAPVLLGTLPKDDVASDLTSCSIPMFVLSSSVFVSFETILHKDVELTWTSTEDAATTGYQVQYSTDGQNWKTLASLQRSDAYDGVSATYHYTDRQYLQGNNFYRISQVSANGNETISGVKVVNTGTDRKIYLGPNPATDQLYVYNRNATAVYEAQVFDQQGRLMYSGILEQGQPGINISRLQKGSYILKLTSSLDESVTSTHFIKL